MYRCSIDLSYPQGYSCSPSLVVEIRCKYSPVQSHLAPEFGHKKLPSSGQKAPKFGGHFTISILAPFERWSLRLMEMNQPQWESTINEIKVVST
ncbi:UNKNOWN [Stylonychia lemnae]|uniref:Uncharacterized protein n=1 Tax=Stylonychia lemnae TaxID=5949 RepID=A0A078AWC8_STYLE|nr:UNKNOWN [Stylonychia lemnae]CDW90736.1 UNKNOWN [Stylonychia lemnae]|eukprot:CDW85108.1 UNKNOWN [Stylonychia lemnae]